MSCDETVQIYPKWNCYMKNVAQHCMKYKKLLNQSPGQDDKLNSRFSNTG